LLRRPPTSCRSAKPISFIAAEYTAHPSVTTLHGEPYFFMIRLRSLSAAALFRFEVTTASNTSPS
jgi:hypothetical protein